MPTHTRRFLILFLLGAMATSALAGCAAQSTYVQAIGTWSTHPTTERENSRMGESPTFTVMRWSSLKRRLQKTLRPDVQLTVYPDARYRVEVAGVEYEGRAQLTSFFGEGLAIKTQIGQIEAQGRIRVVGGQKMILESPEGSLGTELTLHRMP